MWLRNYQRLKQGQELDLSWRAAARADGYLRVHIVLSVL